MPTERFSFLSSDGMTAVSAYRVAPRGKARAMVQISHGMCEYFLRYEGFSHYLAEQGILVFGHDHLGHGNTAPDADSLGFTKTGGGAECLVEDVHLLSLSMKKENPDLPLILFGHSMGSFVARAVIERYGEDYAGAILCGTGGPDTPAAAGKLLASLLMKLFGERHRSPLLKSISFAGYNKRYEQPCNRNAWLTRDESVIEAYNADPYCQYVFTLRAYHDLFSLVAQVNRCEWAERVPRKLPLLLISGEEDPVGSWGKGVRMVGDLLRKAGHADLTQTLYSEMRHEILNELGKERVWEDVYQWIEQKSASLI